MCKSQAQGGQRCAAHTRAALSAAEAAYAQSPTPARYDDVQEARAQYASTPEGLGKAFDQAGIDPRFAQSAAQDPAVRAEWEAAFRRGSQIRERNLAVLNEGRAADPDSSVRASCLRGWKPKNWGVEVDRHVSVETLNRLAGDPSAEVRLELARYRGRVPAEAQAALATDPDKRIRVALAKRSDLTPEVLGHLGEDADAGVRKATLTGDSHGQALRGREHVLARLHDRDRSVRAAAVKHWFLHGVGHGHNSQEWELPPSDSINAIVESLPPKEKKWAVRAFVEYPKIRSGELRPDQVERLLVV